MYSVDFSTAFSFTVDETMSIAERHDKIQTTCDDGVLETTAEEFIFNCCCWQVFRGLEAEFPSSIRYTVSRIRHITTRTHLDIMSWILKDYVLWCENRGIEPNIPLFRENAYEVSNIIYNFVDNELDAQTTDICFDHINEIYKHSAVAKANTDLQNMVNVEHEDIQHVYKVILEAVNNEPAFCSNPLVNSARCGTIKLTQLSMVLGPIGYCTDINSKIIPDPIRVGFFRGMSKWSEMLYESRNASIAALFNMVIMPLSEYGNRRTQLPAENVQTVVKGDCGGSSQRVYVIDKNHLKTLQGFNLTDGPHGKRIKYIEATDEDLIGKHIYIRSLNYCRHKVRNTVCSTCMGLMHYSFTEGAVIGHFSATQFGSSISTSVLQRKHQNLTSKASGIEISEEYQKFYVPNEIGNAIHFADKFKYKDYSIVLSQASAAQLKEVMSEYSDGLIPSQTTRIEMLEIRANDGLESILMPVGIGQRAGFLTKEFLRYVKQVGWDFIDGNLYRISLKEWGNEEEFLTIPQIEFTPPDLIASVTGFMFSGNKAEDKETFKTPYLANCLSVDDAYATFYDLIKDHLKLHSVHLQMIILAMSAQDPSIYDFRLPYPREKSRTSKLDNIMWYRSAGGAIAYEEQNVFFLNPITYLVDRRPPHIYDSIIMG